MMQPPSATFSLTGLDAKTAVASMLGATHTGQRFYPLWVLFEVSAQSGAIATPAIVSVGTNAAVYNNILALTTLTGLTALNTKLLIPLTVASLTSIAPSTTLAVHVGTAAIGTGTQHFKVILGGVYD